MEEILKAQRTKFSSQHGYQQSGHFLYPTPRNFDPKEHIILFQNETHTSLYMTENFQTN